MREITINWNNQAGPMRFEAVSPGGHRVEMDSTVEHGGQAEGFSPKTLLLVSLAGCTGIDVLSILGKMRQEVISYRLEVKGVEQVEHPKKFERITVEHVLEGRRLNPEMVNRAISLSHQKYCGVSASLEGQVEIVMTARLIEADAGQPK